MFDVSRIEEVRTLYLEAVREHDDFKRKHAEVKM